MDTAQATFKQKTALAAFRAALEKPRTRARVYSRKAVPSLNGNPGEGGNAAEPDVVDLSRALPMAIMHRDGRLALPARPNEANLRVEYESDLLRQLTDAEAALASMSLSRLRRIPTRLTTGQRGHAP